eukprot:752374-Hanusia_phi.AAC.1
MPNIESGAMRFHRMSQQTEKMLGLGPVVVAFHEPEEDSLIRDEFVCSRMVSQSFQEGYEESSPVGSKRILSKDEVKEVCSASSKLLPPGVFQK